MVIFFPYQKNEYDPAIKDNKVLLYFFLQNKIFNLLLKTRKF